MTTAISRVQGQPSRKSLMYLAKLKYKGCPQKVLNQLKIDLFCFEMASIGSDYDAAVLVFVNPPKEYHIPFLKELNVFVKALSTALRTAELQRKAVSGGRDSIAASALLSGFSNEKISSLQGGTINGAAVSDLTDEDIEREIKNINARLGVVTDES